MSEIDKLLKEIPLKIRLNVINEMGFIALITKLGYRENKMWTPEEDNLLSKLVELAHEHTKLILEEIEDCKKDGCFQDEN
jgi:hypothetical protein